MQPVGTMSASRAAAPPQHNIQNDLHGPMPQRQPQEQQDQAERHDWGVLKSGLISIPENYLNLDFENCFTENKSTKTIPIAYKIVGLVYKYVMLVVYNFFVFLIGIPLAILSAATNGMVIFTVVWMWGPLLKVISMMAYSFAPLVTTGTEIIFKPFMDMSARVLRQIRINGDFAISRPAEHDA